MTDSGKDWIAPSLQHCYDDFPWLRAHPPLSDDNITTKKSVTHVQFECGYNNEHGQQMCDADDPDGPVVGYAFFRDKEYDDIQMRKNEKEAWKYRAENEESTQLLEQLKRDAKKWATAGRGALFT